MSINDDGTGAAFSLSRGAKSKLSALATGMMCSPFFSTALTISRETLSHPWNAAGRTAVQVPNRWLYVPDIRIKSKTVPNTLCARGMLEEGHSIYRN